MANTETQLKDGDDVHDLPRVEKVKRLALDEHGDVVSMGEFERRLNQRWGVEIERHSADSNEAEEMAELFEADARRVVEFTAPGDESPIAESNLPVSQAYTSVKAGEILTSSHPFSRWEEVKPTAFLTGDTCSEQSWSTISEHYQQLHKYGPIN